MKRSRPAVRSEETPGDGGGSSGRERRRSLHSHVLCCLPTNLTPNTHPTPWHPEARDDLDSRGTSACHNHTAVQTLLASDARSQQGQGCGGATAQDGHFRPVPQSLHQQSGHRYFAILKTRIDFTPQLQQLHLFLTHLCSPPLVPTERSKVTGRQDFPTGFSLRPPHPPEPSRTGARCRLPVG